jgi:hypothetical protein
MQVSRFCATKHMVKHGDMFLGVRRDFKSADTFYPSWDVQLGQQYRWTAVFSHIRNSRASHSRFKEYCLQIEMWFPQLMSKKYTDAYSYLCIPVWGVGEGWTLLGSSTRFLRRTQPHAVKLWMLVLYVRASSMLDSVQAWECATVLQESIFIHLLEMIRNGRKKQ